MALRSYPGRVETLPKQVAGHPLYSLNETWACRSNRPSSRGLQADEFSCGQRNWDEALLARFFTSFFSATAVAVFSLLFAVVYLLHIRRKEFEAPFRVWASLFIVTGRLFIHGGGILGGIKDAVKRFLYAFLKQSWERRCKYPKSITQLWSCHKKYEL